MELAKGNIRDVVNDTSIQIENVLLTLLTTLIVCTSNIVASTVATIVTTGQRWTGGGPTKNK